MSEQPIGQAAGTAKSRPDDVFVTTIQQRYLNDPKISEEMLIGACMRRIAPVPLDLGKYPQPVLPRGFQFSHSPRLIYPVKPHRAGFAWQMAQGLMGVWYKLRCAFMLGLPFFFAVVELVARKGGC